MTRSSLKATLVELSLSNTEIPIQSVAKWVLGLKLVRLV